MALEEHEFKRDENGSRHPHLILFTEQRRNGREGTLLYGEVAPLIASMYARSVQRDIPEDRLHPEVQDSIMEDDGLDNLVNKPSLLENYDLAFDEESELPVLMVSFLGPQHARLLYAHMDGSTLVIRQSKLYSFERRDCAVGPFCPLGIEYAGRVGIRIYSIIWLAARIVPVLPFIQACRKHRDQTKSIKPLPTALISVLPTYLSNQSTDYTD